MNRSRWQFSLGALLVGSALAISFLQRSTAPEPAENPSWARTSSEAGERKGKRGPSGAMKALQYWSAGRAYPNATLPDEGFGLAIEQADQLRAAARGGLDDLVDPWEPIGPANVGGRTLCLAIHPANPDVIFAGSASGGLWKTTVGGVGADAWDYVDVGTPVLGVSTIAIDPADPDVMYIGTGEAYSYADAMGGEVIRTTRGSYGMGILKTTDGGTSWAKSLDWTYEQSKGIWMIQIHPSDPSILYAATTDGVFKSTDAGSSWNVSLVGIMAMDVRIHPTIPSTVFATLGNFGTTGHGIYRSSDDGQNWTKLTTGLPSSWTGKCQLGIAPTSPDTIFASIADDDGGRGLYRSTNRGNSWSLRSSSNYQSYQGWYSHYVVVSPFDSQKLFVGGIEIWRSTSGGSNLSKKSSWQDVYMGVTPPQGPIGGPNYAHADHHFAVWHPTDPNTVFFASDGGVFKSTDLGENFVSLVGGLQTTQFYNGFSNSPTDLDFAIGGLQDNFTVMYLGTGAWSREIGGDGCWTAINPQNDSTIYGSSQYLGLRRSTNQGGSWYSASPPEMSGDYTAFVAPYVLCPAQPAVLYAGRSRVYRSDDNGYNWYATNGGATLNGSNPVLSLEVSTTTPDVAYAGVAPIYDRARVFATQNGGATWSDVTGILPDRYPTDIAVDPNDDQKVYVAFLGFGTSHVFKSIDGGGSWTDIGGGLPDIPTSAVAVDPADSEVVYVGTDLGIYFTTDGGSSWQLFTNGMPQVMVNDLKIIEGARMIRAATHGGGVFERELFDGCAGGPTVTNYCTSSPNSAGPGAVIGSGGSTSVAANDFVLTVAGGPPGNFGIFYYGAEQLSLPFGDGVRCVGAGGVGTFRLGPAQTLDSSGATSRPVDHNLPPTGSGSGAIQPGSTWYFQFWYRDPGFGGADFNLSDGLTALFCP